MNIQAMTTGMVEPRTEMSPGAETLKRERANFVEDKADQKATEAAENKVQPEELLQNIKALTENGLYSVRFEMFAETEDLVINLIEKETGDVIRQIPSEEILGLRKVLSDLRGNFVETKS